MTGSPNRRLTFERLEEDVPQQLVPEVGHRHRVFYSLIEELDVRKGIDEISGMWKNAMLRRTKEFDTPRTRKEIDDKTTCMKTINWLASVSKHQPWREPLGKHGIRGSQSLRNPISTIDICIMGCLRVICWEEDTMIEDHTQTMWWEILILIDHQVSTDKRIYQEGGWNERQWVETPRDQNFRETSYYEGMDGDGRRERSEKRQSIYHGELQYKTVFTWW